jgi:single-stranded DNA-binding protein
MLTVTGYVTGDPTPKDGDYGKYAEINVRWKTSNGKQTNYATAKVYGRKIDTVMNYIHDGDQVTISGPIQSIMQREKKDKTTYFQFYMDCAEFSLPAKPTTGGDTATTSPRMPQPARRNPEPDPIDDEIPF